MVEQVPVGQPVQMGADNPYPALSQPASNPYASATGNYEALLKEIIQKSPYNVYCVDCKKNQSTHCSFFFGVFICETCATTHKVEVGMDKSYVKAITDIFDEYQIKFLKSEHTGNFAFHEFMKEYKMEAWPIHKKYNCRPAKYYKKRLRF